MINLPEQIINNMKEGERVVGYMKTLWGNHLFLMKQGCQTKSGCKNIIYRSENDYEREELSKLDPSDLEKYEKMFISAFFWN